MPTQAVTRSVDYTYQVTALNTSDVESTPSTPLDVRLFGVLNAAPTGATQVRLTFTEAVEAVERSRTRPTTSVGDEPVTAAEFVVGSAIYSVLLTTSITLLDGTTYVAIANNVAAIERRLVAAQLAGTISHRVLR